MINSRLLALGASVILGVSVTGTAAQSGVQTFVGQDDGAAYSGPFPKASAAASAFIIAASALGQVRTETFEDIPLSSGFVDPSQPLTLQFSGGDVILDTAFPYPYAGVVGLNLAPPQLNGFDVTPGGAQWLSFPYGSATFNFTNPTQSFGFFATGQQTVYGQNALIFTSTGVPASLYAPINTSGGAAYYGFTSATPFSSVTITDLSFDDWGIDDVSYNIALDAPPATPGGAYNITAGYHAVSAAPEPSTWLIAIVGFGAIGLMTRRRPRASSQPAQRGELAVSS